MDHKTDTDLRVIRETLEALFEQRENSFGRVPGALRALDRVLAASAGSETVAWMDAERGEVVSAKWLASDEATSDYRAVYTTPLYTHPSPPEGMVGGWRPIAEAPQDDTVVDIWRPSWGGERCPDMRRVDLGDGNVFYEPVLAGPTCVRDGTHFMIVHPPIAAGGGKDAG